MIKISRIEICVGGERASGGTVVKSNYTNGYSGLGWDRARLAQQSLMKNGLFHLSSPQLTWWPTTVFYCGVGVPHCHSTRMHTINVNVICIFSATSTSGIFLKSMMLLSPEHALIPILKEQLLTAQSIKFLSFNKTENKKCEHQ